MQRVLLSSNIKGKDQAFRNESRRLKRGDGMLTFHPYFDIRHNNDGEVVSCTRRPHFTPKEISWYSYLLELIGRQGY